MPGSAERRESSGLVIEEAKAIIGRPTSLVPTIRPRMWNGKDVSVVLMTYAERDSIRQVIQGFYDTGLVDEVLVVDNNAQDGTADEVARTAARLVHEPQQGYGPASPRGVLEATGKIVVLAEPDGTFLPADIRKLLVYSDECDVVFGTRT